MIVSNCLRNRQRDDASETVPSDGRSCSFFRPPPSERKQKQISPANSTAAAPENVRKGEHKNRPRPSINWQFSSSFSVGCNKKTNGCDRLHRQLMTSLLRTQAYLVKKMDKAK